MTQKYPEEITNVVNSSALGALAGFVYGGLPAARHARERYIQVSQAELYTNRVDAVVSEICAFKTISAVVLGANVPWMMSVFSFNIVMS